jgi:hypothetical protein
MKQARIVDRMVPVAQATMKRYIRKGTVPSTIVHAVRAIKACRKRKRSGISAAEATVTATSRLLIDLLTVVVHVETPTSTLVRLWISDASLEKSGHRAQILLFGKANYDAIVDVLRVRAGDVMRFNRVDLRVNDGDSTSQDTHIFWHSIHDPDTGPLFFRLCHIDRELDQVTNDAQHGSVVPTSMETEQECLEALVAWYRSSSIPGIKTQASPLMHSKPCLRRTLAEFHNTVGAIGHVVATVVQVVHAEATDTSRRQRKRKQNAAPRTVMVTLTDDNSSTLMTLYLDHSSLDHERFCRVLCHIQGKRQPVRLSNVLAKSARDLPICLRCPDEVVLLPTSHTTMSLASDEETREFLSRATTEPWSSQTQPPQDSAVQTSTFDDHVIIANSAVYDMTFKGESLADIRADSASPLKLHGLLVESKDKTTEYGRAFITLKIGAFKDSIVAEADGTIVKTLCGGLDTEEWSPVSKSALYRDIVWNLLRGLLTERIELQWRIQRSADFGAYKVTSVSLRKLHTTGSYPGN